MKSAKQFLMVAGAFVLAALTFTLVNSKTVHAFAATLVQVVNSYSSPAAVVRADDPGRSVVRLYYDEVMQAGVTTSPSSGFEGNPLNDVTTFAPYTVPAGKRLVVDSISAFAYPPTGQQPFEYMFNGGRSGSPWGTFTAVPLTLQQSANGTDAYLGAVAVHDYVDPGQQYLVAMFRSSGAGAMFWNVQVVGHLVDCTNGGGC